MQSLLTLLGNQRAYTLYTFLHTYFETIYTALHRLDCSFLTTACPSVEVHKGASLVCRAVTLLIRHGDKHEHRLTAACAKVVKERPPPPPTNAHSPLLKPTSNCTTTITFAFSFIPHISMASTRTSHHHHHHQPHHTSLGPQAATNLSSIFSQKSHVVAGVQDAYWSDDEEVRSHRLSNAWRRAVQKLIVA